MFWYYLQSQTNKALLVSKNLKSILVGEKPICVCIYIYTVCCVSVLCLPNGSGCMEDPSVGL